MHLLLATTVEILQGLDGSLPKDPSQKWYPFSNPRDARVESREEILTQARRLVQMLEQYAITYYGKRI